ncbi:hypothetical protein BLOT_000241 [Blomia tropicalis]|nr:hypothetical protein BLOT_000241 [Blomia tropicalis]
MITSVQCFELRKSFTVKPTFPVLVSKASVSEKFYEPLFYVSTSSMIIIVIHNVYHHFCIQSSSELATIRTKVSTKRLFWTSKAINLQLYIEYISIACRCSLINKSSFNVSLSPHILLTNPVSIQDSQVNRFIDSTFYHFLNSNFYIFCSYFPNNFQSFLSLYTIELIHKHNIDTLLYLLAQQQQHQQQQQL